jgi:hypothetical protein
VMKTKFFLLSLAANMVFLTGCSGSRTNLSKKDTKAITSFSFILPSVSGVIDETRKSIIVTVPSGTAITSLVPVIVHDGISISPQPSNAQDFSSIVNYTVSAEDGSSSTYSVEVFVSDLPVMAIETDNREKITSKETWIGASYVLFNTNGQVSSGDTDIKGRGNTTWLMPKKPYALKLNTKAGLLGMPAHKRWVLLANYADKTLLRTDAAFKLGTIFNNLNWTPRSEFIALYLNSEYLGVYQLTEQIKIDAARVDIGDSIDEDSDGGYILEVDVRKGEKYNFTTTHGAVFNCKDPDEDLDGVIADIIAHVQAAEDALYADNFLDPSNGYRKYLDIDSFVDWYLVSEFTKNLDSPFQSSVYMYYNPVDSKFYMGPLWDFDLSLGNADPNPEGYWIKNSVWISRLFEDPSFVAAVKARWDSKTTEVFGLNAYIDDRASFLNTSQRVNFRKWDILEKSIWPNPYIWGSYQGGINYLKSFVSTRLTWLDTEIDTW